MAGRAEKWIRFLRKYGPIPQNDNMFDEHIRRSAKHFGIDPFRFEHPLLQDVMAALSPRPEVGRVVILTGTAGDGKSHLCGLAWKHMGGSESDWATDEIYRRIPLGEEHGVGTLHVIRDLTALRDEDERYGSKVDLLEWISRAMLERGSDIFLIAANDGQIVENWRRLDQSGYGGRALKVLESRLMGDKDPESVGYLEFFNLSTVASSRVLELSMKAFLGHEAWAWCYDDQEADGFFGPDCPIRRNFELLSDPLVASRLTALFRLCDFNGLHTPIRRVLMLLTNAVLGSPDVKDRLLQASWVRQLIADGGASACSLYSNIFGENLAPSKRETLEIFEYLRRYGIGNETTNRIDNILIFGKEDDELGMYWHCLMEDDHFYGATDTYKGARRAYVDNPEGAAGEDGGFLDLLVAQRRGLFFKIPDDWAEELDLWKLTVFNGAGEYLKDIVEPLEAGEKVRRDVVHSLVKGLNRVFTGLLVSTDRELLLATSLSNSAAKVSRLLEDRISVSARNRREKIEIVPNGGVPRLEVTLPNDENCSLGLNLTRYEFLRRVADGALPGNFSRECYEDIMSFKSALLAASKRGEEEVGAGAELEFRLITLDAEGQATEDVIEVSLV